MIRFSALLVVLAIGLLVAGVVASSLLMVYISIAVCAVAALLLVAGVLWHWSEIFGHGQAQPASPAASGPAQAPAAAAPPSTRVDSPGMREAEPVGAGYYGASRPGVAAPAREPDPAARRGQGRGEEADQLAIPGRAAPPPDRSRRGDRRPGRKDPSGRPPPWPAEPAPPQPEQPAASRPDDLWERVNEELESAGKRDTGALTWPATEFTAIPPAGDELAPAGEQPSGLGSDGIGDLWQPAAGWQPPASPQLGWPTRQPPAGPGAPGTGGTPGDEPEASEPTGSEPEAAASTRTSREANGQPSDGSDAEPEIDRAGEPAASAARNAGDREIRESPAGELHFSDLGASDLRARESLAANEDAPAGHTATGDARAQDSAGDARAQDSAGDAPAQDSAGDARAQDSAGDARAQDSAGDAPAQDSAGDVPAQEAAAGETPARDAAATGAAAAGTARTTDEDEARAADEAPPAPGGAATEDGTPRDSTPPWTIASWRPGPEPADEQPAAEADEQGAPADEDTTSADGAGVDEAPAPEPGKKPNPAEGWLAAGTVKQAAKPQGDGQVEVTVVPGVARYHRSGCILIRFLGTGDLELMPRQQAQDAGFAACRACQPDELKTG